MRLLMTALAALCYAPPDGGGASPGTGGASPAPSADASVPEGQDGGELSAEPSAEDTEPQDDLDAALLDSDEEHDDLPFKDHPRFKATRNKLRTAQRQLAKLRGLRDRVQTLGDLDQLAFDAQAYRRIAPVIERNPKFRASIYGEQPDEGRDQPEPEPEFDDAGYPYERESPQGQYLYRMARELHETRAVLRALSRDFASHRGSLEQSSQRAELSEWSRATRAAAEQLPKEDQQMFMDAVYGAYQHAKAKGLRIEPQKVIEHYLKGKKRIPPAAKASASAAAARQVMAQRNQQQPRAGAVAGQGQPAPAHKKRLNVFELGKQIRRMSN